MCAADPGRKGPQNGDGCGMTCTRRRFLTITAGFALAPVGAQAHTWQGRAFGADVSMTIRGRPAQAQAAFQDAARVMREVEGLFSLYDPNSALSRLNKTGTLTAPDPRFTALMQAADHANRITEGLFDPSVQPLWQKMAQGGPLPQDRGTIGWTRMAFDDRSIRLATGQALTFNGIAQGYATDKVTEVLTAHGLENLLVNIGEYRGTGGPWRLGIQDPAHGTLGHRTLHTGAIATSSPAATPLGHSGHIIHPTARAHWSTVSVEAPTATLADALSTALVLAPLDQIRAIKARTDISRVTLVDAYGDLITL